MIKDEIEVQVFNDRVTDTQMIKITIPMYALERLDRPRYRKLRSILEQFQELMDDPGEELDPRQAPGSAT